MKMINLLRKARWYIATVLLLVAGSYYFFYNNAEDTTAKASFYVVETVGRGEVTSGIRTTGDIVAAQKLDIDVYKQLSRIDVVNVQNGSHVEKGEVLIAFDKNDAYVDTKSAQVSVVEAELALAKEQQNSNDPNTEVRTKENQIAGYKKTISDTEQDIKDAYQDFLNVDLEVNPHKDKGTELDDRTAPILSGRYVSTKQGQYVIDVYSSGAESGYSFRVSGLESITSPVVIGKAVELGVGGLQITFPVDTKASDKWVVSVPNNEIATFGETKRKYEEKVADLEKIITDAKVALANAQIELGDLKLIDGQNYRNLDLEKAETALAEARQRLSQNYDVVQERNIVAPFSGTVEGMENVVAGATPTGGTSDSINLGTLISDEFLTTFTLSASDVAKVVVGQKVKVTVTSFVEQPVLEATITQISSLPEADGVAQYEVQALLSYDRNLADIVLREGMLADIEVVEKENKDALRVPTAAITYEQGVPKISVVDTLTEEQQQQVTRMGIIKTGLDTLTTYQVEVKLGIVGSYYVEVTDGLKEGDLIIASSLTEASAESVVQQAGFGPGSGQRPPSEAPAQASGPTTKTGN